MTLLAFLPDALTILSLSVTAALVLSATLSIAKPILCTSFFVQ